MFRTALLQVPRDSVTAPEATLSGTLSDSTSGVGDVVGLSDVGVV